MNINQRESSHRPAPSAFKVLLATCGVSVASGLLSACGGQNPASYWVSTPHGQNNPPDVFVPANDPAKRFIGKGPGDLFKELGPPSQTIPFPPTGGKMFIYAEPGKPHYVFETNGLNRIDRAATVQ